VALACCLNEYDNNAIIISILENVSKSEGVHDSWHVLWSHWKPVYLDETSADEAFVMNDLEISFAQCGSHARGSSAATTVPPIQPITCGVV